MTVAGIAVTLPTRSPVPTAPAGHDATAGHDDAAVIAHTHAGTDTCADTVAGTATAGPALAVGCVHRWAPHADICSQGQHLTRKPVQQILITDGGKVFVWALEGMETCRGRELGQETSTFTHKKERQRERENKYTRRYSL